MCDTLVVRSGGLTWFAKNSDREPDEPQALLFRDRVTGDCSPSTRVTYLDIPQVAVRHATLLSQPHWMWGAEIGVNEHGVVIGNEAVFGRLVQRRAEGLLGMDLLRLGLERGASAREALELITDLLTAHGQGGGGGYRDKRFRYDNAFIIADFREAWVLETAGRLWAARRVPDNSHAAISNCYSIGSEFDLSSPDLPAEVRRLGYWNGKGEFDFARSLDTRLYAWVGGAHRRRALNDADLCVTTSAGWAAMATRLRDHGARDDHFARHDNRQICLHAGSVLRPSQTTASLIAQLAPGSMQLMATATSAPCLSLFQPVSFAPGSGHSLTVTQGSRVDASPWWRFEAVHQRALFDSEFRRELHAARNALEPELQPQGALNVTNAGVNTGADTAAKKATDKAMAWHHHWRAQALDSATPWRGRLGRYWAERARREAADAALVFASD